MEEQPFLDLRSYCDESGTDANSRIVVVGGYVAPTADWSLLETQWLDVLKTKHAPYYHATDAEARIPGGPYAGWTVEQARELTDLVAAIAASIDNLKGIGAYVATVDWIDAAELIKPYLSDRELRALAKRFFNIPFQILAKACVDTVLESLKPDLPQNEKVAFIFEDNDFKYATLEVRDEVKRTHPLRERIGSIDFRGKRNHAGLQAADLLAWSYRRVTEVRRGYKTEIHRSLRGLIKQDFQFRHLTREQLFDRITYQIRKLLRGEIQVQF